MKQLKRIEDLETADLQAHSVWQYANIDAAGETLVRPVRRLPVTRLAGKVIGTQIRLANGSLHWALLGNMAENNARLNEHFLTLSVFHSNRRFTLARYHDLDYSENGPDALADFLSLPLEEIFPIAYDLRSIVKADERAIVGLIQKEPIERLSRAEIIALAVP